MDGGVHQQIPWSKGARSSSHLEAGNERGHWFPANHLSPRNAPQNASSRDFHVNI